MVEIFRTNVVQESESNKVLEFLESHLPEYFINFDLEDQDKVLRVEAKEIDPSTIINLMKHHGFMCEVLC